jgi:uncharacterized protein
MSKNIIRKDFIAKGTTCESCSEIIRRQALKVEGVKEAGFDYATEKGFVVFDKEKVDISTIFKKIGSNGYECSILEEIENKNEDSDYINLSPRWLWWSFAGIGFLIAAYFMFHFVEGIKLPQISQSMGYGLLLILGLLTGFHCIAMCGGFVVSYTAKNAQEGKKSYASHLMYATGKTLSYTLIGAVFGLIGSIITFTPLMRGISGILAGTFLVLFGLKMLNIFPIIRRFQLKTPNFIARFVGKNSSSRTNPLIIGLLNGLMIACGPLQAVYIMAAGTGSMVEGAKLLFVFGLGTLPVMLGFGYFTSIISSKATNKILKISGAIVIILGLIMFNRGLALTGTGFDTTSLLTSVSASSGGITENAAAVEGDYQVIKMNVTKDGWEPNKFVLKKGVPVKWVINGKELNSCNNAITVPKLGLNFDIKQGEQTIEFTPTEEGTIPWSCWMGMIQGTFIVKGDIDLSNTASVQQELNTVSVPKGSSCGCGGK